MKECIITNNPLSQYINRAKDEIQSNKLHLSSDFLVTNSQGGTHISLNPRNKYTPAYTGLPDEYEPGAAYDVGDMVRVLPNKNYEMSAYFSMSSVTSTTTNYGTSVLTPNLGDYTADVITAVYNVTLQNGDKRNYNSSFYSGSPTPGTYVCRASIPKFLESFGQSGDRNFCNITPYIDPTEGSDDYTIGFYVAQQYGGTGIYSALPYTVARYLRFANVNYYPTFPEVGYLSITASCANRDNMISRIGRYWDYIGSFGSGFRWAAQGRVYNIIGSYYGDLSSAEEVYVKSTDPIVTTGVIDPQSKQMVYSSPGVWRCLQNVTPVVNPSGLPVGTYYNIPQLPYPVAGDPNNSLNYWLYIAPEAQCFS
jgi:hypothetical protein